MNKLPSFHKDLLLYFLTKVKKRLIMLSSKLSVTPETSAAKNIQNNLQRIKPAETKTALSEQGF